MRRVRHAGLAGVPGVVLTESDRRLLRSRLGIPAGGLAGACVGCPSGGTDQAVAIEVARRLGASGLVDAIKDPAASPAFENAAKLAAATMESVKFRKDFIATVSGITSPTFAVLAGKTAKQLSKQKKLGENGPYAAVLLLYVTGAIDDASGRNTPLAADYRKALKDLNEALAQAGSVSVSRMNGLGKVDASKYSRESFTAVTQVYQNVDRSPFRDYDIGLPGKKPSDPSRFYPPSRKSLGLSDQNTNDLGTPDTAPSAIDFVPYHPIVLTLNAALKAENVFGRASLSEARKWAKDNATPKDADPIRNAAIRISAWIIRSADDGVLKTQLSTTRFNNGFIGNVAWLAMARRYGARNEGREKDATAFEKFAAGMMVKASKQALARTGQTGGYGTGSEWRPDPKSSAEQVPQGPEAGKYTGFWSNVQVDPKIRIEALLLAQLGYQMAYRKEPTTQALNWYGSFGYGVQSTRYVISVDPGRQFVAEDDKKYIDRIGKLEALRMAGAEPPPQDVQNNTNVFMSIFNALGPALSVTLEVITQAVNAATEVLCQMMRVIAGPDVGGVLCTILTALIKFLFGTTKGAIAGLFSIAKALTGFIGKLISADWMGALYELFAGVNTAVIFVIGGPIADLIGVPFLKSDERGNIDSPDFVPSLERMGESLTKKNPFFLILLVVGVIALIVAPVPANVGSLLVTLTPVMALICVVPAARALRSTQDKNLVKYKNLPNVAIEGAIESILRIISSVIVGVLSLGDAMKVIGEKLARWAERQGGTGPATVQALKFFMENLQTQFVSVTVLITKAFTNDQGFELKQLTDELVALLSNFLALLPAFALETGEFDKDSLTAINLVSEIGASTVDQAKAAYDKIVVGLDAEARQILADQIAAEPKKSGTYTAPAVAVSTPVKPQLPLLLIAAAAGITVGFMFRPKA